MTKITTAASVSLDGYIPGPEESGFDHLFQWYGNGDVHMETTKPDMPFDVTEASAGVMRELLAETGCLVVGRHLFDMTNGWDRLHPLGIPYVCLTHSIPEGWERESEWYSFVTEGGIEAAVEAARKIAGDKNIVLNGGTIASQGLEAGLLDEVELDLVPVLLGSGTPFFPALGSAPYTLEGPILTVQGNRVTHLRYRVIR